MKDAPKFFICKHCGNVAEKLVDSGVPMICCGEPMEEMKANTTDAAQEKHVPVVTVSGNEISVQVGSVLHPMLPEHHIGWIWLDTKLGGCRRSLTTDDEPKAVFTLAPGDEAIAVYEWCNLHGLWKADVK
ncbi:MAG: desulfoferrodoxin [Ruminococcaceae bacterium]|nr:desulfoferrodoxin [Oscillospiraceae bacterium]